MIDSLRSIMIGGSNSREKKIYQKIYQDPDRHEKYKEKKREYNAKKKAEKSS